MRVHAVYDRLIFEVVLCCRWVQEHLNQEEGELNAPIDVWNILKFGFLRPEHVRYIREKNEERFPLHISVLPLD